MSSSSPMALLSIPISTTLIIFFFFFTSSITHAVSNQTCPPPSKCGDISIRYPFWLNSSTTITTTNTSYCGYPGFGLTCKSSNEKYPILHLPNDDYFITAIDYEALTVTLVDIDVYNRTCPRPRHNFTFDHSLNFFHYTPSDLNLTFLFNCDTGPSIPIGFKHNPLSCLPNSYVIADDLLETDWYSFCKEALMLPALNDSGYLSDLQNNFGHVLNLGFELNWVSDRNCGACEKSDGSCFYDKNNQGIKFAGCLCRDDLQGHNCRGRKNTITRKIVIGQ
ncbi:hypothetical protein QJS04_geneDACA023508 [Acorus gramineus]|uniref:Uncharacterized protein n=1 Tax=Acorus gramineus TaxID=55184 RepID=A0AAV9A3V6_ACOGR|nr:hypothetical protein QJS04_geneDACA023508 [Acorus gramineus]